MRLCKLVLVRVERERENFKIEAWSTKTLLGRTKTNIHVRYARKPGLLVYAVFSLSTIDIAQVQCVWPQGPGPIHCNRASYSGSSWWPRYF